MKTRAPLLSVMILFGSLSQLASQGTLEFTVRLTADQNLPPSTRIWDGFGGFTLSPESLLEGQVTILRDLGDGGVTIYYSTSADVVGTPVFALTPGDSWPPFIVPDDPERSDPGGRHFIANRVLSDTERDQLFGGHWWAVYTTPDFPTGELRGQIVPEPSTILLLVLAGAGLCLARWCQKRGERS